MADDDLDNEEVDIADEDDTSDDEDASPAPAPAAAAAPTPATTAGTAGSDEESDDEVSAARRRRAPAGGSLYDDAREAYQTSQEAGIHAFGLNSRDPALRGRQAAYMKGLGAYSPEEIKAVQERIDPKREMGTAERNLATYGAFYRYYMDRGDPDRAAMAAFRMSQYYRQSFDHYKALAAASAEKGDVRSTVFSLLKAYEAVPDGQDMRVVKDPKTGDLQATWFDSESGQRMGQKIMKPQELLQWASGGMLGHGDNMGWDALMAASGQKGKGADKNAPSEGYKSQLKEHGLPDDLKPTEANTVRQLRNDKTKADNPKAAKGGNTEAFDNAMEAIDNGDTGGISFKGMKPNEITTVRKAMKEMKDAGEAKGGEGKPATASTRENIAFRGAQTDITALGAGEATPEKKLEVLNQWRKRQGLKPYDMDVVKTEAPKKNSGVMGAVWDWITGGPAEPAAAPAAEKPTPAPGVAPAAEKPAPAPGAAPATPAPGAAPAAKPASQGASGYDPKKHQPIGTIIKTKDGEEMIMDPKYGWRPYFGASPVAPPTSQ